MARGVQHRTGLPAALLHTSLERECPVIASAQWESRRTRVDCLKIEGRSEIKWGI